MKAVVFRGVGVPVEVTEVRLDPPGPGEVMVRIAAAGVCHSDLHMIRGEWGHPLPVVLGHEGSGTVVEVGRGVTGLAVGDHVVLSWVAPCGSLPALPRRARGPLRGRREHRRPGRGAAGRDVSRARRRRAGLPLPRGVVVRRVRRRASGGGDQDPRRCPARHRRPRRAAPSRPAWARCATRPASSPARPSPSSVAAAWA